MNILRLLIIVASIFVVSNSEANSTLTDLPIAPGATKIQHFFDKPAKGIKSVIYEVEAPFPAEGVTTFFHNEMKARGYQTYKKPSDIPSEKLPEFAWVVFDPASGEWVKTERGPARYKGTWVNRDKDEIAWVIIDYKYDPKNKSSVAQVSWQVSILSMFEEEGRRIEKTLHNQRMNRTGIQ